MLLQERMWTVWKIYAYTWESHSRLDELQQVRYHCVGKASNCMSQYQWSAWNVRGNYYTSLEERFAPLCKVCSDCCMGPVTETIACLWRIVRLINVTDKHWPWAKGEFASASLLHKLCGWMTTGFVMRGYQKREFSGGRTVLFCQPNRILKAMVTRVKSFACKINIKINTPGYDNELNAH